MFVGEYIHTVDNKGRVIFPAKFRDGLKDGLVVTVGTDDCLVVFKRSAWPEIVDKIKNSNPEYDSRMINRMVSANAFEGTPDKQGRFTIPQNLRDYASLENEIVITGLSANHIEIWSMEKWAAYKERSKLAFSKIKAGYSEIGF